MKRFMIFWCQETMTSKYIFNSKCDQYRYALFNSHRLEVKQSPQGNYVPGLTSVPVSANEEVVELMARCDRNRSQTATDMNEHSSRSHMMLTVIVESRHKTTNATSRGKMNLVRMRGLL